MTTRINELTELCRGQGLTGVDPGYIRGQFKGDQKNSFVIAAWEPSPQAPSSSTQQPKQIKAWIKATVHKTYGHLKTLGHIVSIDLLCSTAYKGLGSVLLNEATVYARQNLCASMLVLDSVFDANTFGLYVKQGFVRASNACQPEAEAIQANKDAYAQYKRYEARMNKATMNQDVARALDNRLLLGLNKVKPFPDTVFYSKCIGDIFLDKTLCHVDENGKFFTGTQRLLTTYRLGQNNRWKDNREGNGFKNALAVINAAAQARQRLLANHMRTLVQTTQVRLRTGRTVKRVNYAAMVE